MKKLPSIYKNEINKKIKNNREVVYIKEEKQTINEIIDSIFSGAKIPYSIPIIIRTNNKTYETSLVSRDKNNLLTLNNDLIKMKDILSIEIKKF